MTNLPGLLVLLLTALLFPASADGAQLAIAPILAGALIGGGAGLLKGIFGKAPKTTQQHMNRESYSNQAMQGLDPNSQAFVDQNRQLGQAGASLATADPNRWFTGPQTMSVGQQAAQFMNPYMSNVIDPMRAEFDRMRSQASNQAGAAATAANSFGGSRHGLVEGSRLGAIDAAQGQQIGNLLYGGYNNALTQGTAYTEQQRQLQQQQMQAPLWAQGQAINFMNQSMGPTGSVSSQSGVGQSSGTNVATGQKPGIMDSVIGGAASGAMFGNAFGGGGGGYGLHGNQAQPGLPAHYGAGLPPALNGGPLPGYTPFHQQPWMR